MAFNLPFATSDIIIGSDKNKISIDNNGSMVFVDGSFVGTEYENGITLADLANSKSSVTLDDLIITTNVTPGNSYNLLRNTNGTWSAVKAPELDTTTIIQVETTDWSYNSTLINGEPGYAVTVPHNLGLTLPSELLSIGLWNVEYEAIIVHRVRQGINSVYLESVDNIDLYITMRKS